MPGGVRSRHARRLSSRPWGSPSRLKWSREELPPNPQFPDGHVPVHCRCDNVTRCARCLAPFRERRICGNEYRDSDGHVWHWPGFLALDHPCPLAEAWDGLPEVTSSPEVVPTDVRHEGGADGADNAGGAAGRVAVGVSNAVIPFSNFNGKGPTAVSSAQNSASYEVFDLAGNAREWCWNAIGVGRAISGGAWDDHYYMRWSVTQAPAFDRAPRNGFRCVRLPDRSRIPAETFTAISVADGYVRDFSKERPVSDSVFTAYARQYSYDPVPLDSRVEGRAAGDGWVREKVSFSAPYGEERVITQVFIPTGARPPYQAVVYFPGSGAAFAGSSDVLAEGVEFFSDLVFFLKSGRAVVYPVYKGTHERRGTISPEFHWRCDETHGYATYQRPLVQDVRRTIDYLQTRPDIDGSRLAFEGMSWGGLMAPLVLAVERRFVAAIIVAGGLFDYGKVLPEVDGMRFAPRVTLPVLILHGRYDLNVPWETEGKPLFDLLGTGPPDKVLKLYETDHWIPRREMIKESLAWLDKHLGPVNR